MAVDNSCLNVLGLAITNGIGKAKTERKDFCYSRSQGVVDILVKLIVKRYTRGFS